jgi:uncharacterized delta-60 repeat protein
VLALAANGCTGDDPTLCTGSDCNAAADSPDGGGAAPGTAPGFDITSGASISLIQGGAVDVDLTIARNGFDGPITTSVTGLPAGVAAAPLVVPAGATSAKLSLSSLPNAVQGTSKVTISASDSEGKLQRSAAASLLVRGAAGAADTTFGTAGRMSASIGATGIAVQGIATQADGKIVVTGASDNDLVVVRVGVDGTLDTSYGAQGKVTADLRIGGVSGQDEAESIAVAPDGSTFVSGWTVNPASIYALARFTPAGALDTSFNATGYLTTVVTPPPLTPFVADFLANAVTVQADGKPVFCGEALEMGTGVHSIVVSRAKTNGALDDTFGDGQSGFFYRHVFEGATPSDDTCAAVSTAPGDKLVVAGTSSQGGKRFFVARLDKSGLPDTTFGNGGFAQIPFAADATAQSVHVLPDGRVLVVGDSSGNIVVARLDAAGAIDTAFGGTGKAMLDVGTPIVGTTARSVLDGAGRVVVMASVGNSGDFVVARVLDKGVIDPSFGTAGHIDGKLGAVGVAQSTRIAQAPDGRIVVAANLQAPLDLVAFRFWN